jgi:hypothetical protein
LDTDRFPFIISDVHPLLPSTNWPVYQKKKVQIFESTQNLFCSLLGENI